MIAPRPFIYNPPAKPFLSVVFYDDDILVLNKASGLLSVAGNRPELADCLEGRAKEKFPSAKIIHRLDKDTSGLIVLGLNAISHAHIGLQFEKRQTKKEYIARVWGRVSQQEGQIDEPIITDWPNRPKQMIDYERGRSAITNWKILQYEGEYTRLLLRPVTGRSHQLRLHLLHIGHPILGDNLYAHDEALVVASRLQLHAGFLSFIHPKTGKKCEFELDCPF